MTWSKVTSLVCRFWSLPWTNGPNTQFKWKLRYSPIQCANLEPSTTYYSDCRRTRIGLKIGNQHRAVAVCIDFSADVWQMRLHVYTRLVVTQVWIEKQCNKNIAIGFQNAVFNLCQQALVPLLQLSRPECEGLYLGLGKTGKALLIT